MKDLWKKLLWVLALLLFVACGGDSTESTTQMPNLKEFKVEVNVPNSVQRKASSSIQKVTDSIAVTRVEIDIKDKDDNLLLEKQPLLLVNGIWSGAFVLDTTNAPFTFLVYAYDAEGIERYSGTSIVQSVRQSVVLSVSSVPQDGDTIKVPYLKGITSTLLAGGKQQLNVTVVNETFEDMDYNITAIPDNGCILYFEPNFGTVKFKEGVLPAEQTFRLIYSEANSTCSDGVYYLEMKTLSNQGFKAQLNLQNGSSGISVNFPPKIDSFNFTQNDDGSMIFKVSASDAEGGDILYTWEEIVGIGDNKIRPLSGTDSNEWVVEQLNYPEKETYSIKVTLTDDKGAVRYYTYQVNNNTTSINTYKYPIKKTGQVTSYFAHDDGAYQKGVTPSYTRDATKEVVIDNIEGYMWQDDSDVATKTFQTRADAAAYCQNLSLGGYNDWELPRVHLLYNLLDLNTSLTNRSFLNKSGVGSYFSSTTYSNTTLAIKYNYTVVNKYGYAVLGVQLDNASSVSQTARCIRPNNPLIFLGSLSRSSQGIVTDGRYGLEWQDDYNGTLTPVAVQSFTDASNYCEALTLGGKSDWRLPNIFELMTLVNYRDHVNITDAEIYKRINSIFQAQANSNLLVNYISSTSTSITNNPVYVLTNDGWINNSSINSNVVRCVRDK